MLVDAGGRGRCHIVGLSGIVRYLADHFTVEYSTSRFYNNVIVTFLCCIVWTLKNETLPQNFPSTLSFNENDAGSGISLFYFSLRERHLAAAGTQHSSIPAFAAFEGALLCNRMARALPHPLSTEQGLLAERLPQPYNVMQYSALLLPQTRWHSFPQNFFVY